MRKKNSLRYELYGSAGAVGGKGYWRWMIISAGDKKLLQVGSFYGAAEDAKKHAEAAILRLKKRVQNNRKPRSPTEL